MKIIIVASSPVKTFYQNYHLNPSDYFIGIDAGSLELIKRLKQPAQQTILIHPKRRIQILRKRTVQKSKRINESIKK